MRQAVSLLCIVRWSLVVVMGACVFRRARVWPRRRANAVARWVAQDRRCSILRCQVRPGAAGAGEPCGHVQHPLAQGRGFAAGQLAVQAELGSR